MKCEICGLEFIEGKDCITLMTMHTLIRHYDQLEKEFKRNMQGYKIRVRKYIF